MNTLGARHLIALAGISLTIAITPVWAQDKAAPKANPTDQRDRKVLVENEKVLVTENRYAVGAASGMTERVARVVRALSDGTLEKTYADGRKETVTWKTGQVRFSPKETYSQKNIGKTDVVLYTVSLKQ